MRTVAGTLGQSLTFDWSLSGSPIIYVRRIYNASEDNCNLGDQLNHKKI